MGCEEAYSQFRNGNETEQVQQPHPLLVLSGSGKDAVAL